MKPLSEDQLQLLQEYAAALMHITEIAVLLDIPPDDQTAFEVICVNDRTSPLYRAFHTGRLQTKLELRRNIIKLAKAGSPAAEPIALKFINEQLIGK
ncbi:MAG: hypothetical protein AAGU18_10855 [Proteiniphilum sp.]